MAVLNVPVFFSVLDARQNLAVVELERNEHAIDALLSEGEMFCVAVDERTGLTDFINEFTAEQIATLVHTTPSSVEVPQELLAVIMALNEARATKKSAEEAEKNARDEIARVLLHNEVGTFNGAQVISWKQQAGKKSVDVGAMREAHPEVVAQFEREGFPYRVMRITNKKEK